MDADLDTLVTAPYVKIDDALAKDRRPGHPVRLGQSELVCLAVAQALLGFHSEHRWIRFAICHPHGALPYLPHQPGYNKRLRAALPLTGRSSGTWPPTATSGSTPSGSPTPPRSNAAARAPRSDARTWPGGRTTATAPPTPPGLGAAAVFDLHPGRQRRGVPIPAERAGAAAGRRRPRPDRLDVQGDIRPARVDQQRFQPGLTSAGVPVTARVAA